MDQLFGGIDCFRAYDSGFPATWSQSNGRYAKTNTSATSVIQSMKPDVATTASGGNNAALLGFLRSIPIDSMKKYLCLQHEPENPNKNINAAQWRQMQSVWQGLINQVKAEQSRSDLYCTQILMAWTLDPASGRNPEDWYANTDVLGWDPYTLSQVGRVRDYSIGKGKPWLIAEIGTSPPQNYTDSQMAALTTQMYQEWTQDSSHLPLAVTYFENNVGNDYRLSLGTRPLTLAVWKNLCTIGAPS